jgi:antitoxin VapB
MAIEQKLDKTVTAKLFRNGRSQAVRLPKEFRFEGNEVRIRRVGQTVVLEPLEGTAAGNDWTWLREWRERFGRLDEEFVAAAQEKMPMQERPELDLFFAESEDTQGRDRR